MIESYGLEQLPTPPGRGSVVSIGVFDGVHLGHQAILAANLERARELGARPTVVTFGQHPKRVLLGRAPRTLTSLEHRLDLFRQAGIEHTLVLEFDAALRSISAEEFTRRILLAGLGARAFVLGFDSKFGRDRGGTPESLARAGHDVRKVPKVELDGRPVSSTAIREAVELGDLEGAARMLGRPVSVLGTVVEGERIGRGLGFPTANLDLHHELHPPVGVYVGRARVLSGEEGVPATRHGAVANIGVRPTLGGTEQSPPQLEVHLLDFEADIYGREVEFSFLSRLREEQRFEGLGALQEQLALDVAAARKVLAELPG